MLYLEGEKVSHPNCIANKHNHLWTDALHARALAHQAQNRWDRGTYVRWAVVTAWTVLEVGCQEALDDKSISYSFRKKLDEAIERKGFAQLEWGSGIWQSVTKVQEIRKDYMHRFLSQDDLFPSANLADEVIEIVRAAVKAIYEHVTLPIPAWIQDNESMGWDSGRRNGATVTFVRAGAYDDTRNIKICFVARDKERLHEVLPPGTDYRSHVEELIASVQIPITTVRVYEGEELIHERVMTMRGA